MDYKSPLEGSYDDCSTSTNNYGPRYSPYGGSTQGGREKRRSLHHQQRYPHSSQAERSSQSTSQYDSPKYSDRFKRHSYPKALTDLMGALNCKLCGVEVPSPIVAKMHYSGKQHAKKVKLFLVEHGHPVPEQDESLLIPQSTKILADYCEICDVKMTSINDKLLHYSGKNHRKNSRDPANAKKKCKKYETINLSHRFGIGTSFSTETLELENVHQPFVCELCSVNASTHEQLNKHLLGKKHKEKLEKKNSLVPQPAKPHHCNTCNVSLDTEKLLEMHLNGKRHAKNLSKLESQDGGNYCDVCDQTFTCSDQLKAHLKGKKHEKMCKQTHTITSGVADDKVQQECHCCPFVGKIDNHKCDFSLLKREVDVKNTFVCEPCHNMVFDTEELLKEHNSSKQHILRLLNQVEGDTVVEEFKDWYCIMCKKQTRNVKEYTEHLFDISHMSLSAQFNVGSQPDILCNIYKCFSCNIMLDKESFEEHLKDRKHLTLALGKDTANTLANLANKDIQMTGFHCATCDVIMYNFVQYSTHVTSTSHLNKMVTLQLKQKEK